MVDLIKLKNDVFDGLERLANSQGGINRADFRETVESQLEELFKVW